MSILDEGKKKFVAEVIEMKKPDYVYKFEKEICEMNLCYYRQEQCGRTLQEKCRRYGDHTCKAEMEAYKEAQVNWRQYQNNEFLLRYLFEDEVKCKSEFTRIAGYYKIIPFIPSVMINISPDWSVLEKRTNNQKTTILKGIINKYILEGWYQKWSYVIENGGQGDHIHAHFVGELNKERQKSTESHLARGNHTKQLQKYSKKLKGCGGLIKGVSVQRCMLRTETLVKDKLDYLIEEKKPEGHKNHSIINDGFVSGSL